MPINNIGNSRSLNSVTETYEKVLPYPTRNVIEYDYKKKRKEQAEKIREIYGFNKLRESINKNKKSNRKVTRKRK